MKALLGLLLAGALAGCGTGGTGGPPLEEPPLERPAPSPPAEGSAAYDALVIDPVPGELARGGNDTDPALTTQRFRVTVPAGARLGSQSVCSGQSNVSVVTEPDSDAAADLPCSDDEAPAELVVEQTAPAPAATTYDVTVTAPAPARWFTVLYAVPG